MSNEPLPSPPLHSRTILPAVGAAVAALALTSAAFASEATNELAGAGSAAGLPSVELEAFYGSRKMERGMVENAESVFGYEAKLEWLGFFAGVEACYDMTDANGRCGRYNEIASSAGYGAKSGDLSARAAYIYKKCKECGGDEPDTQEVELEAEYETPWLTPFLVLDCDIDVKPGATYGVFGLKREWNVGERLTASACGGIGFGNAGRNSLDFDADRCAFRDMHLGAALEIELCPHVKLVPSVDFYDQFTSAARHEYRKGFVAVCGVRLSVEF